MGKRYGKIIACLVLVVAGALTQNPALIGMGVTSLTQQESGA